MAIRKLAVANFLHRKVRVALTVAAIALSVSLVVSTTSGYASFEAAVFKYLNQYLGTTDVEITRANDPAAGMPESLLGELRADPDVADVDGRYEIQNAVTDLAGKPGPRRVAAIGIRRPGDTRSDYLKPTAGAWFDVERGNVAVIDQALADALKVGVGQDFLLPGPAEPLRLTVVGLVHKPALLAQYMQTVYMPVETLQDFAGKQGVVSRVELDLAPGADPDAFSARWMPRLEAIDPNLRLRLARDTRDEMEKNLGGVHALSYLGGTVTMLAATFIVFSALSMGVSERQRTLAMLRAVGAQKRQVGALVVAEGLLLAGAGAAIGVPLGYLWIRLLAGMYSDVFAAGAVVNWGGVLFGSLGSIGAALLASILPAWSATRVSPLEAMNPEAASPRKGPPWRSALAGLLLISVDPFLFFGPLRPLLALFGVTGEDAVRNVQFFGHFGLGLPCVMVGFFLLAPMFVWVAERAAGPLVAWLLGIRYAMLRQQLTTGIWRAAGTCAALMVGLAVLVVLQTNGHTALSGWRLPDKFPDVFIFSPPTPFGKSGLNREQEQVLASVPGVKPGELMAIGVASPGLGTGFVAMAKMALMPDATMYIAVPPDKAFTMMELEFRAGNAQEAAKLLALGDHLVVTEEFYQLKGLGVGDKLSLKTNQGLKDFTIAGVVWSPGMDVMVSMFDMGRQFDQRTAASVFGSLEDGRKYFGIENVYLFAANLEPWYPKEQFLKDAQDRLGGLGMQVGDVRQIKHEIVSGLRRLLLLVSTVAFAAMAVASLGVTNTIMASVRSRRWQFGVLRSIGVTRGQLLRLVLAEAILIGLVGCGLGLAAGFEMAFNANKLGAAITGYAPPVAVPWPIIGVGVGIVLAVSLLASLFPALGVARAEPLELLQAGRASA